MTLLARLALILLLLGPVAVLAQTEPGSDAPRWRAERGVEAAPGVHGGDMTMVTAAQTMAQEFRVRLAQRLAAVPRTVEESRAVMAANSPTGRADYFLWLIPWTLSFLTLGSAVVWAAIYLPLIRPRMRALLRPDPDGIGQKLPMLILRAAVSGVLLVLSMVTGFALGAAAFNAPENATAEKTVVIVFAAWALSSAMVILWRIILSPNLPAYRLVAMPDAAARRTFRWVSVSSVLAVAVHAWCTWMYELGLSENVHAVVVSGLTLLAVAVTIAAVAVNRGAISGAILGGVPARAATPPVQAIAALWAPGAIVYLVVTWGELTYRLIMGTRLGVPPILGFFLVIGTIMAVHGLVLLAIARFFRRRRQRTAVADGLDGEVMPPVRPRIATYEDLATRVAGIIAFIAGVWALLQIWQASLPAVDRLFDQAYDIGAVLLIGYVSYQAARIAIDNRIEEEGGPGPEPERGDEGGARGASRLATLLPLVRTGILVVIVAVAGAMVAMELGINLAPLFAGAGVVGIAIGFGAQYLIRDVFAGAFFLIDDAFRRGEYIDVGDVKGTVEKISIRSFQLRHHLGPLHTIPFGEIKSLTNYSRDWVIMKLPLRVTYDTDVEKVRKLVKQLGQELLQDPVIGDQFLAPLKSQGVIEMQDSAMIIRVKFMTKPGDQWLIRQRVYQEIRALFQREGIKFAHREVTVRMAESGGPPLTQAQREAVAAAALDLDAMPEGGEAGPVELGGSRAAR